MHCTLCDFILDIVQNSIEAGSPAVELNVDQDETRFSACIRDNGSGMTPEELERAPDPFHTDGKKHRNRKVGLGLPFLKQAVELTGGTFDLRSKKNSGTEVFFGFPLDHIDTPPVGDLPAVFMQSFLFDGEYEMTIGRVERKNGGELKNYVLRRSELREVLGNLNESGALLLLRDFLEARENETDCD